MPADDSPPALKEIFNAQRFRSVATDVAAIYPEFDRAKFLKVALAGLDDLNLLQRMRRLSESLHATLPSSYRESVRILRELAPRLQGSFATLALSDFVGQYGRNDVALSLQTLAFLTTFGSSEFAIREFLRRDLPGVLSVMEKWSRDRNEHVRRLASEGSRPRLPWSFRLTELIADPSPTAPILENLKLDDSLYVRKSVANHLNDITKDHPGWVLDRLVTWPLEDPRIKWIAKRALRTLIKKGDRRALALIGADREAEVRLAHLRLEPRAIALGEPFTLSFRLISTAAESQRLVVDYVIHYVKKSGATSAKVFKLKELTLAAGEEVDISRRQTVKDFTTRVHHPGRHEVEILVNGAVLGKTAFELRR